MAERQLGGETKKPQSVLTDGGKGSKIDVREKVFNLSYEQAEHLKGKMTNEVARGFYVRHIENISKVINSDAP